MKQKNSVLELNDPWYDLRQHCFGNVEPQVKLEAATSPLWFDSFDNSDTSKTHWSAIEALPAIAAGTSYGTKEKLSNSNEKAINLNKKLIRKGHHTPLEAIQLNFHISGISKACGAQLSRYRVGQGHVSASRRYQTQHLKFVYPILNYIKDEVAARNILSVISNHHESSMKVYNTLRKTKTIKENINIQESIHKEDARFVIPLSSATERSWWVNVRALRYILNERINRAAEPEIRRLCVMIYNVVISIFPSLFEDLKFSL